MTGPRLADPAAFERARCVGRHELFDARQDHESPLALAQRHQVAVDICTGCPCLAPCADLYRTLPRAARGFGVWAGRSREATATEGTGAGQ